MAAARCKPAAERKWAIDACRSSGGGGAPIMSATLPGPPHALHQPLHGCKHACHSYARDCPRRAVLERLHCMSTATNLACDRQGLPCPTACALLRIEHSAVPCTYVSGGTVPIRA